MTPPPFGKNPNVSRFFSRDGFPKLQVVFVKLSAAQFNISQRLRSYFWNCPDVPCYRKIRWLKVYFNTSALTMVGVLCQKYLFRPTICCLELSSSLSLLTPPVGKIHPFHITLITLPLFLNEIWIIKISYQLGPSGPSWSISHHVRMYLCL